MQPHRIGNRPGQPPQHGRYRFDINHSWWQWYVPFLKKAIRNTKFGNVDTGTNATGLGTSLHKEIVPLSAAFSNTPYPTLTGLFGLSGMHSHINTEGVEFVLNTPRGPDLWSSGMDELHEIFRIYSN